MWTLGLPTVQGHDIPMRHSVTQWLFEAVRRVRGASCRPRGRAAQCCY